MSKHFYCVPKCVESGDKCDLFGPEHSTEPQDLKQSLNVDTKENEYIPSVQTTETSFRPLSPPVLTQGIPTQSIKANQSTETTHQPSMPQVNSDDILKTSQEIKLYKRLKNMQLKLSRCKNRGKRHFKTVKMAQNIMKNKAFIDLVENMTNAVKILNLLQCRKQKRKLYKFTFIEQITSLSIYKQSPKAYQFLSKIFWLPASQTLDKLIQKVVTTPGISKKVLKQLRNKAKTMWAKHRLCVLLFDEVALQPFIDYGVLDDKICILKEEGSTKLDSHVVVFMLKGLFKNYMQPIVYSICSEATKAVKLKTFIQSIIRQLRQAGFVVVATVCKPGANNQEAIESLIDDTRTEKFKSGEEHKSNTFYIGRFEIVPFYDPPHLLKDMRNNLLNEPLQHENKEGKICTAKWEHIQMLYAEVMCSKHYRILPKLTEQHVEPGKINKMELRFASQVFSQQVAAYMNFMSVHGILPPECTDTAHLVLLIDELFDTMNGCDGNTKIDYKPLLNALTPSPRCPHHKKWLEAKQKFRSMELLNANNIHAPTLQKYLWTIEAFQCLSRKLAMKYGISSIWTGRLNQDPLQKFLGLSGVVDAGIISEAQPDSNQHLIGRVDAADAT